MTETTTEGYPATTTTFDNKNGVGPTPLAKVPKKSVSDDLATTFSSPAAWFLVVALIVTWSAVAIVMFDLVDYKNLVADIDPAYSLYCDEPCLPPGKHQVDDSKVLKEAKSPGGGFKAISSDPMKAIDEAVEDTSDWIYGFISVLYDILTTTEYPDDDMDEAEIEPHSKKKGALHPPAKRKVEAHPPSKRKAAPPEIKSQKPESKIKAKKETIQKSPLKVAKIVKVPKPEEKLKKLKIITVEKRAPKLKKVEKLPKKGEETKPKLQVKKEKAIKREKSKSETDKKGKKSEKEPAELKSEKVGKRKEKVKDTKERKPKSKDKVTPAPELLKSPEKKLPTKETTGLVVQEKKDAVTATKPKTIKNQKSLQRKQ
ncbi:triadin isoform X2 [Scyliorhinus canicula]|uniref:triadin isoform X2 n=1 Tax=Scyliorhinus canicula TaxID=7830 RepID=UPI0018F4DBBD|nr:triadin isoform X2 [Scyliorhinus canicula]